MGRRFTRRHLLGAGVGTLGAAAVGFHMTRYSGLIYDRAELRLEGSGVRVRGEYTYFDGDGEQQGRRGRFSGGEGYIWVLSDYDDEERSRPPVTAEFTLMEGSVDDGETQVLKLIADGETLASDSASSTGETVTIDHDP